MDEKDIYKMDKEQILDSLTKDQEETLQAKFMEEQEIGGIPITKDNYEYLYENWIEALPIMDLHSYLE